MLRIGQRESKMTRATLRPIVRSAGGSPTPGKTLTCHNGGKSKMTRAKGQPTGWPAGGSPTYLLHPIPNNPGKAVWV